MLDTPPEDSFDTLTRLAADALNTPIAAIGLMDTDRLWFKSQLGLDAHAGLALQVDRHIAFCVYAIMQPDQVLVVEDLRLH